MKSREQVVLYHSKKDCCGCGTCMNVCPKQAITMVEDECGFVYPEIDSSKCVRCYACKQVCALQNDKVGNEPRETYVAANENTDQNAHSSSGGAFAALASWALDRNGIIYGAAYTGDLSVECLRIVDGKELGKLQGSKYVQSRMGFAHKQIQDDLKTGRTVLFSGTPCQVAAVKSYLRRDYENFFSVDIICHGVPSQKMLRDYLSMIGHVDELQFRDKKKGWEDYFLRYKKGKRYHHIHCRLSSYYEYFLQGKIYRENCYSCKYASKQRYSDITIGDYWGIRQEHSELLKDKWWEERLYDGISCVIVNTEKGKQILKDTKSLRLVESDYKKASRGNGQLREPTQLTEERDRILALYKEGGWQAVDNDFRNRLSLDQKIKYYIKSHIPVKMKRTIKEALGIV